jgi:hypothetical protein
VRGVSLTTFKGVVNGRMQGGKKEIVAAAKRSGRERSFFSCEFMGLALIFQADTGAERAPG